MKSGRLPALMLLLIFAVSIVGSQTTITASINGGPTVPMISNLSPVAVSGAYSDLTAKPTIPSAVSQLSNDSGYALSSALAPVATTGSYTSLTSKPTIPTALSQLTNDANYATVAPITTYTFPAANLLAIGTYTQNVSNAAITSAMAGNCSWVGNIGTTTNVTIQPAIAASGSATIGYKNNAILGTGVALTLRCQYF